MKDKFKRIKIKNKLYNVLLEVSIGGIIYYIIEDENNRVLYAKKNNDIYIVEHDKDKIKAIESLIMGEIN